MAHKGNKHGRAHSEVRRTERRKEAEALAAERAKRSPKEQLALLDKKLGKGVGAKKERDRLHLEIHDPKSVQRSIPGPAKPKGLSLGEKAVKEAARSAALVEHERQKS